MTHSKWPDLLSFELVLVLRLSLDQIFLGLAILKGNSVKQHHFVNIADDESMQIEAFFESGYFFEDESVVLFFVDDGLRRKTDRF